MATDHARKQDRERRKAAAVNASNHQDASVAQSDLSAYEALLAAAGMPNVMEVHRLSGDIDYLIRAVVPDMRSYDEIYKKMITDVGLFIWCKR